MALRRLMHADLGTVLSWRNSPAVRAGSFDTHFISAAEHQAWFQRISRDPHCYWLIFARDEHSVGVGYFTKALSPSKELDSACDYCLGVCHVVFEMPNV